MTDKNSTESELTQAIETAARKAFAELFAARNERFYYVTLITNGDANAPVLSAWSHEALEDAVKGSTDKDDAQWGLKWSYADSPYFCYGDDHFDEVREMFKRRPDIHKLDPEARRLEYDLRMRAMERAMATLDAQGLFGVDEVRDTIVINVEVMPPDHSNTERAIRLNPPDAIRTWLDEAAE